MILRSITRHVREQNWFAVGLDFLIVIVGVFIGIQVANWNESRLEREREALLIQELRDEVLRNTAFAQSVGEGLLVGARSARRILSMGKDGAVGCSSNCWGEVVDLMHASQWQQLYSQWSTFEELRRAGLPSDRRIIDAVEALRGANHRAEQGLEVRPRYRTLVRELIPIELQDAYWATCFRQDRRFEIYVEDCPAPDGIGAIDRSVISDILSDADIRTSLRQWTSTQNLTGIGLTTLQPELADNILAIIDAPERTE